MAAISSILHRATGQIRFSVDPVEPRSRLLPLKNSKWKFEQQYQKPILAFSHSESFEVVEDKGCHPVVAAVHLAFSVHFPLLLTPDIIWMVLAQGFAQHINNCAEKLRSRFVRHSGKKELKVTALEVSEPHHWTEAIEQWTLQIRDCVGADLYRLMECNFSTTTPTTRTASHVVMMDAFKQYFDYSWMCIYGIPEITLMGTVEDWQSIRDRVELMAQYDLNWWTEGLLPICQELIETAAGKPKLEFWKSIYKPEASYGGEVMTGWPGFLFPYLKDDITQEPSVKNPMLAIEPEKLTVQHGIHLSSLPSGLASAPFTLNTPTCTEYPLELIAGFIGIRQHSNGILEPEIGWVVTEGNCFAQLLDLFQREHQTFATMNWSQSQLFLVSIPAELVQLLERFNGATLFAGSEHPWQILKSKDWQCYYFLKGKTSISLTSSYVTHFINLKDGRCIAYVKIRCAQSYSEAGTFKPVPSKWWVVLGKPIPYAELVLEEENPEVNENNLSSFLNDPTFYSNTIGLQLEDTKVIAKSIVQFFERMVEAEGRYYFDEPDFQPDDSLTTIKIEV